MSTITLNRKTEGRFVVGILCLLALTPGSAFGVQCRRSRVPTQLFSAISIERTAKREIGQFQEWAVQCGVQVENGFSLVENVVDGNEDWSAATTTGGPEGSRVLFVPNEMILSSARIAQEYGGYVESSFEILGQKGLQNLYPHFFLFLRLMVEYEQGSDSPYYPWLAAMPRKWNTAVSMDEFCLSCLPPFIKSLCQKERDQLAAFREALQVFEYLSPWAKANQGLAKFVYSIVFTRSRTTDNGDLQIIPVVDMFNHGYPGNVMISNDQNGNCDVVLADDVPPGTPLLMSYGDPTNPSQFLVTYGFLNEAPAAFCKILISNPSQELKDIGYDPSKMLVDTATGAVSQEVWDVILYSRLERKPDLVRDKRNFYKAHMAGDEGAKAAIHQKYLRESCSALRLHVDNILAEVADLAVRTNAFDSSKHPRLPLIRKHNSMVTSTFMKVRANVEQISAQVLASR